MPLFDGGYTIGGLLGNGYSFVTRDAHGIRPAYYYIDDEVIVAASERAAIRTAFNVGEKEVKELMPACALVIDDKGNYSMEYVQEPKERRACSFERIYFSRGSDEKIYRERISLGYHLSNRVLENISYDLKNTIFSYIPNTAEVAFYGLVKRHGRLPEFAQGAKDNELGKQCERRSAARVDQPKNTAGKNSHQRCKAAHFYYGRCKPQRDGATCVRITMARLRKTTIHWW